VLDQIPGMRARSEQVGATLRAKLEDIASRVETIGEVRGLGSMLAIEIVRDRESKTPAPELVGAAVAKARGEGLLLLACGLHGNVIRLLPPLTITDEELTKGLAILEAALV
jgi:4-aminobutyrate aminotransferase-like enzyme